MTRAGNAAELPITLTHYVYTPAAIEQTMRAFHELCEVQAQVDGESTHVRFRIKTDTPSTVCDDFLNFALELSAQEHLSRRE